MDAKKVIIERILSASAASPIAVELVGGKLSSYFYSTVKAPASEVQRPGIAARADGATILMPKRENKNQLGVFHGVIGAANFKKMCFDLGL